MGAGTGFSEHPFPHLQITGDTKVCEVGFLGEPIWFSELEGPSPTRQTLGRKARRSLISPCLQFRRFDLHSEQETQADYTDKEKDRIPLGAKHIYL